MEDAKVQSYIPAEMGQLTIKWAGGDGSVSITNAPPGTGKLIRAALDRHFRGEGHALALQPIGTLEAVLKQFFGKWVEAEETPIEGLDLVQAYLDGIAESLPLDEDGAAQLGQAAAAFARATLNGLGALTAAEKPPLRNESDLTPDLQKAEHQGVDIAAALRDASREFAGAAVPPNLAKLG